MNGQPQLSIIIVNHRTDEIMPDCLESVAASNHSLALEVIIVDNPAETDRPEYEIPKGLSAKRISAPRRIGFGAACNLGAEHASGEYILFLNPDIILEPDAIQNLYTALSGREEAAIVAGRLVGTDGEFQASCRRFPTLGNLLASRQSMISRIFGIGGKVYTLPDYDDITEVEVAAAAMMMMSRETFDRLQGFDDEFFLYMEDTDLCYRAFLNKIKVFYVPQATGRHLWGYSTGHYRFRRILWHHISTWKYFAKHHPSLAILMMLGAMLLINCALSLAVELFTLRK